MSNAAQIPDGKCPKLTLPISTLHMDAHAHTHTHTLIILRRLLTSLKHFPVVFKGSWDGKMKFYEILCLLVMSIFITLTGNTTF